jgi:hypothetical protein
VPFLLIGSCLLLTGLALPRLTIDFGSYELVYRGSFLMTTALVVLGLCELVCAAGMFRGASGQLPSVLAAVVVAIVAQQLLSMMWIADGFRNPGVGVSVGPGAFLVGLADAVIGVGGVLARQPRR